MKKWVCFFLFLLFHPSWGFVKAESLPPDSVAGEVLADVSSGPPPKKRNRSGWFPQHSLFPPPLADPTNPRLSAFLGGNPSVSRKDFISPLLATVFFGLNFPVYLWSLEEKRAIEIGFGAAAIANFDVNIKRRGGYRFFLANTDFPVGVSFSYKKRAWAARLRFHHFSSHVGDNLIAILIREERVDPKQIFEEGRSSLWGLDLFLAYEHERFRVYGGGGGTFRRFGSNFLPPPGFYVEGGGEFNFFTGQLIPRSLSGTALLAIHVRGWQANQWTPDITALVGYLLWGKRLSFWTVGLFIEAHHGVFPHGRWRFLRSFPYDYLGVRFQFSPSGTGFLTTSFPTTPSSQRSASDSVS